jgi:hypothetical protein
LCRYADAWDSQPEYNDDSGIVKADRTSILNQTHKLFEDRRLVIPRWCPEVETFILQCIAPAKRPETNSKTGRTVYRYFNSKPDHYRHALNYALLAAMKCPISNPTSFRTQQNEMVVHEYQMF